MSPPQTAKVTIWASFLIPYHISIKHYGLYTCSRCYRNFFIHLNVVVSVSSFRWMWPVTSSCHTNRHCFAPSQGAASKCPKGGAWILLRFPPNLSCAPPARHSYFCFTIINRLWLVTIQFLFSISSPQMSLGKRVSLPFSCARDQGVVDGLYRSGCSPAYTVFHRDEVQSSLLSYNTHSIRASNFFTTWRQSDMSRVDRITRLGLWAPSSTQTLISNSNKET